MSDGNNGSGVGQTKRPHDDSSEGASAKKPRGGYDKIEIRLLIPYNTAGAIIGKGGSNIKELRQEYNANVQIPDSNGVERIITISTKSSEDAANVAGRVLEALMERLGQREKDGVLKLLVHKSQAGTIIGIKGARIKELRETTGANIRVNQECCPDSTDRICQMKGAKDTVVKCLQIIIELLQEAPPKGPMHNYDPDFFDDGYDYGGYNSFDRDGGMNDRGRRGPPPPPPPRGGGRRDFRRGRFDDFDDDFGGEFRGRRGRGGPRGRGFRGGERGSGRGGFREERFGGGRGGGSRAGYGGYGDDGYGDHDGGYDDRFHDRRDRGNYDDYDDGYGGDGRYGGEGRYGGGRGGGGGYDDDVDGEITTQVTIPTDLAGSIIGKGGQRIRQIRQDSGAMIRINEPEQGSSERIITIIGTESATQNAQYLLQKSVKMFSGERFN